MSESRGRMAIRDRLRHGLKAIVEVQSRRRFRRGNAVGHSGRVRLSGSPKSEVFSDHRSGISGGNETTCRIRQCDGGTQRTGWTAASLQT
jgi:hypothetical protein